MSGGADGDLALQHTADHTLHAVGLSDGTDLLGLIDTTGLHQLDIDQISGSALDQLDGILRGEYTLICQDGGGYLSGDKLHTGKVMGMYRLLHQVDIQATILHGTDDTDGILRRPALVGIHTQDHIRTYGLADGLNTGHILQTFLAYLDLQDIKSIGNGLQAVGNHLVHRIDTDGDIGLKLSLTATQYLVQGLTQVFGIQIIYCHIYCRLGGSIL